MKIRTSGQLDKDIEICKQTIEKITAKKKFNSEIYSFVMEIIGDGSQESKKHQMLITLEGLLNNESVRLLKAIDTQVKKLEGLMKRKNK